MDQDLQTVRDPNTGKLVHSTAEFEPAGPLQREQAVEVKPKKQEKKP